MKIKKKAIPVISLAVLFSFSILITIVIFNRTASNESSGHYTLRDDYYDENQFKKLTTNSYAVFDLDNFNKELHNSNTFDYFEIVINRLYIFKDYYLGDDTFGANYEFDRESYTTDYNDIALIKSLVISQNFLEYHNITLSSGRHFRNDDFIIKNDINVILGNDYKELYNIGDIFDIIYFGRTKSAHVVGFLDENMSFHYADITLNLNNFIIVPFETFEEIYPLHTEEGEYQFKCYLDKNSGILYTVNEKSFIENEIVRFSEESNLLPYMLY